MNKKERRKGTSDNKKWERQSEREREKTIRRMMKKREIVRGTIKKDEGKKR